MSAPTRLKIALTIVGLLGIAASYAVFFLDRDTIFRLGREDGLFENLTAVFFFVAALLFAFAFWRSRPGNDLLLLRTRRNVFFLLLALLFLVGAGEEISWGQRIIGWETPPVFEAHNLQGETNIHNLRVLHRRDANGEHKSGPDAWLTIERLFSVFWFAFCLLVPLLYWLVPPLSRLLRRVGMPIVPLGLGLLFLVNYGTAEALKEHALGLDLDWPLMEIKECLFSLLFLLIAICFVARRSPFPAEHSADATGARRPRTPSDEGLTRRPPLPVVFPAKAFRTCRDDAAVRLWRQAWQERSYPSRGGWTAPGETQ